jgi:hypothetical protein
MDGLCTARDVTDERLLDLDDYDEVPMYGCYSAAGVRLGDGMVINPITRNGTRVEFVCGRSGLGELAGIEVSARPTAGGLVGLTQESGAGDSGAASGAN